MQLLDEEKISCFLVCVRTGLNYDDIEYPSKAEQMQCLLECGITDRLSELTKGVSYTDCNIDVEVNLDYDKQSLEVPDTWSLTDPKWELCGRAVLEFRGPKKVTLDKPKLTRFLRTHQLNPWGETLRVEKRALPQDWCTQPFLPEPQDTHD